MAKLRPTTTSEKQANASPRSGVQATLNPAAAKHRRRNSKKGDDMDAKYNGLIDNIAMRLALNTVAFALWLATAVALLELAVKV